MRTRQHRHHHKVALMRLKLEGYTVTRNTNPLIKERWFITGGPYGYVSGHIFRTLKEAAHFLLDHENTTFYWSSAGDVWFPVRGKR